MRCSVVLLFVVGILWVPCLQAKPQSQAAEATVITKLKVLLKSKPGLKHDIEHTLARTRQPLWMGSTINDFIGFFKKWLTFQQTPDSVARYFILFQGFMNSPGGEQVINSPEFRPWLNQFMLARGAFLDSPASKSMISNWISNSAVHINDYIIPPGGFTSFNQFFTRNIKPGKRTANKSPNAIDSPADGVAFILSNNLILDKQFTVKHDKFNLAKMLGSAKLAQAFHHGKAVLIFLGAKDYHHFRAPVAGKLVSQQLLGGTYEGRVIPYYKLIAHRRAVMIIDSPSAGKVAVIPFGMYSIGSIKLLQKVNSRIKVGADLGYFQYGGSTVVLLFQNNKADFSKRLSAITNSVVKAGERIGVFGEF